MYAYKSRVKILNNRELVIKLPVDIPEGDAEVIVISDNKPPADSSEDFSSNLINKLDEWISQIPKVPHIPLSAISRDELYK